MNSSVIPITEHSQIHILAGNFSQAQAWANENGISRRHWSYACVNHFRGYQHPFYVIVGTFLTENNDCHRIIDELKPTRPIELRPRHLKRFQGLSDGEIVIDTTDFLPPPIPQRLKTFKTIS